MIIEKTYQAEIHALFSSVSIYVFCKDVVFNMLCAHSDVSDQCITVFIPPLYMH